MSPAESKAPTTGALVWICQLSTRPPSPITPDHASADPAVALDWTPAYVAWTEPWFEVAVDVTGSVQADGTVTFLLSGAPDVPIDFGSRESGAPPACTSLYAG